MRIVAALPFLLGASVANGGALAVSNLLRNIAERHELHIIAFDQRENSEESEQTVREMREWAASVRTVPLRISRVSVVTAKLHRLLFHPYIATLHSSSEFRQACTETLATHKIDLALVHFSQMAQYVAQFRGVSTLMDVQDANSVSAFRDYAGARSLASRIDTYLNWLSCLHYERRYFRQFSQVVTLSEQDSAVLSAFNPGIKTSVLPPPIDLPKIYSDETPKYDIGFIGSFTHRPNLAGLEFLLSDVLPLVRRKFPDVRVLVAGKNPPRKLVDSSPKGVEFAGFVPSIEEFYQQVGIVVAPLITGGGVKIKVIEGLLSSRPVVTTSIGAEGIGLVNNLDALICADPEDLAEAIVRLVGAPALRESIGQAGRRRALAFCSTDLLSERIDNILKTACKPH